MFGCTRSRAAFGRLKRLLKEYEEDEKRIWHRRMREVREKEQ